MEERLDKLFKDKLANHRVAPTSDAWEQLHGQLEHKKQNIWARRLAIAATLLLLVSVSFVGYKYLNGLEQVTPAISQSKTTDTKEKSEAENSDLNNSPLAFNDSEVKDATKATNEGAVSNDIPVDYVPAQIAKSPEKSIAKSTGEPGQENPLPKTTVAHNAPEVLEQEVLMAATIEEDLKETEPPSASENITLVQANIEPQKSYPKVRIVYKADANSTLVVSNNRNLLDKGINKITKFSDEHIVTDQVKTKLRNTKDDLLALNFGKLLNKSNKDVDN
jgi:hypothetical protein